MSRKPPVSLTLKLKKMIKHDIWIIYIFFSLSVLVIYNNLFKNIKTILYTTLTNADGASKYKYKNK